MKMKFDLLDNSCPYRYWSPGRIIAEIREVEKNPVLSDEEREEFIGVLQRWLRIAMAVRN